MTANPILLQKKYVRVVDLFAKKEGIALSDALDFFYNSMVYQLMRDGVSDMHCMSDDYLVGDLCVEYQEARQ
ncbi:MAG: DUF3791 domain-containing protein [Lachnospiraceae bacterium]|nr:DUF3791 domain-containing protein [Lachnospiraceae bacterium]